MKRSFYAAGFTVAFALLWPSNLVFAQNTPPQASGQEVSTPEDTVEEVVLTATDADGDPLTYEIVTPPSHGTLEEAVTVQIDPPVPNNTWNYTPDENYHGSDSFTFRASDGEAYSNTAEVTVTIDPVNDPPVPLDDDFTGPDEDNLFTVTGNLFDDNGHGADYDVDGDPFVVYGFWWHWPLPDDGTFVCEDCGGIEICVNKFGGFAYTPYGDWQDLGEGDMAGCDWQYYLWEEGNWIGDPPRAWFSTSVMGKNDGPVDVTEALHISEDYGRTTSAPFEDIDSYAEDMTFIYDAVGCAAPVHGTLEPQPADNFRVYGRKYRYEPDRDYFGPDSFTFKVCDNYGECAYSTVEVAVDPRNDPPVFVGGPDQAVAAQEGPVTVPGWATEISPGPANEAGQAVHFLVTDDNGAIFSVPPALSPEGTLTFTPSGTAGEATVTVRLQDDGNDDNPATEEYDTSPPQTFAISVVNPPAASADFPWELYVPAMTRRTAP